MVQMTTLPLCRVRNRRQSARRRWLPPGQTDRPVFEARRRWVCLRGFHCAISTLPLSAIRYVESVVASHGCVISPQPIAVIPVARWCSAVGVVRALVLVSSSGRHVDQHITYVVLEWLNGFLIPFPSKCCWRVYVCVCLWISLTHGHTHTGFIITTFKIITHVLVTSLACFRVWCSGQKGLQKKKKVVAPWTWQKLPAKVG